MNVDRRGRPESKIVADLRRELVKLNPAYVVGDRTTTDDDVRGYVVARVILGRLAHTFQVSVGALADARIDVVPMIASELNRRFDERRHEPGPG